jgi:hypothetical protein
MSKTSSICDLDGIANIRGTSIVFCMLLLKPGYLLFLVMLQEKNESERIISFLFIRYRDS